MAQRTADYLGIVDLVGVELEIGSIIAYNPDDCLITIQKDIPRTPFFHDLTLKTKYIYSLNHHKGNGSTENTQPHVFSNG